MIAIAMSESKLNVEQNMIRDLIEFVNSIQDLLEMPLMLLSASSQHT